jgi:UDP-N-acetylmuramate dehydrogenase
LNPETILKELSFMEIQTNFSLKNYNTFIEAKAKQFVAVHSVAELKTVLEQNKSRNLSLVVVATCS